jgi:hypothetical protein
MPEQISDEVLCGGKDIIKIVKNTTGTIRYSTFEKAYLVVVIIPNTIDSQDIGVVCNLPSSLKSDGIVISFGGEYRKYDKQPIKIFGGQTFYYLKLTKIVKK